MITNVLQLPGIGHESEVVDAQFDEEEAVRQSLTNAKIEQNQLVEKENLRIASVSEFLHLMSSVTVHIVLFLAGIKLKFFIDKWFTGDSQIGYFLLLLPILHLIISIYESVLIAKKSTRNFRAWVWIGYKLVNKLVYVVEIYICFVDRTVLEDLNFGIGTAMLVLHFLTILIIISKTEGKKRWRFPVCLSNSRGLITSTPWSWLS